MSKLSEQQIAFLLGRISPRRVRNLRGMAHLEAWDVRRTLVRAFGFDGFTVETISLDLVHENMNPAYRKKNKAGEEYGPPHPAWTIVYRAQVRLTVKALDGTPIAMFEDAAAGDAINQPSVGDAHDLSMKTALSQALKRCAVNLGDQFGLSLYDEGSGNPVVIRSLAYMGEPVAESEDAPVGGEPMPQAVAVASEAASEQPSAAGPDVTPEDAGEREAALKEMRAAAEDLNFADGLPAQFEQTFGHPIEQGTVAEYREATALMHNS